MDKKKFVWQVACNKCETTVTLEVEMIFSTDQGAGFIRVPKFICGKCKSACVVELVERK